jgi:predicted nucleic acid-binding protein
MMRNSTWQKQRAGYDCEFIATANDLKVPLVTVDKQLLREFPSVAISLKSFSK